MARPACIQSDVEEASKRGHQVTLIRDDADIFPENVPRQSQLKPLWNRWRREYRPPKSYLRMSRGTGGRGHPTHTVKKFARLDVAKLKQLSKAYWKVGRQDKYNAVTDEQRRGEQQWRQRANQNTVAADVCTRCAWSMVWDTDVSRSNKSVAWTSVFTGTHLAPTEHFNCPGELRLPLLSLRMKVLLRGLVERKNKLAFAAKDLTTRRTAGHNARELLGALDQSPWFKDPPSFQVPDEVAYHVKGGNVFYHQELLRSAETSSEGRRS